MVNDRWEKNHVTTAEVKAIKPFLERICTLKQQGLTDFGIISSFLCRQVQPLKERENYGFEYSRAEDPSRMVPALELTYEEVLERLQKMLKGVSVVPLAVLEYSAKNSPSTVSCSFLMRVLLCVFCCIHFCLIFLVLLFYSFIGIGA